MLPDLEIWRAAHATIQAYGAGLHAAQRADELTAEGDMDVASHRARDRQAATDGTGPWRGSALMLPLWAYP